VHVAAVSVPTATRAPTGRTNAYVVGRDPAVLVDPAGRTDDLDALVADRGVGHVALTHTHPDHVDGVAHYVDATDATLWAKRGREAAVEAATARAPDATFAEGEAVPTGGGALSVLDVPGHAADHVAFVAGNEALVGDLAVARGSVVVGAPEGDMRGYVTALRRLHARDLDALHPGHGPTIEDPRATLERLLAHRIDRERRVEAAVRDGANTVDAVLDAAYDKDLAGVRDLAAATLRAHLEKLAVEGRVHWDGERTRPA
jgi:ribonuclease/clavin/mitogillin